MSGNDLASIFAELQQYIGRVSESPEPIFFSSGLQYEKEPLSKSIEPRQQFPQKRVKLASKLLSEKHYFGVSIGPRHKLDKAEAWYAYYFAPLKKHIGTFGTDLEAALARDYVIRQVGHLYTEVKNKLNFMDAEFASLVVDYPDLITKMNNKILNPAVKRGRPKLRMRET